ncbi:MAG: transglutaminase family protein [Steroidobacteraceae bacterium]|nr:transglutaminase family protein [Steroidobacteraceae bacterium]
MSIHVALNHVTHYRYDRLVALGPQIVRLRPAPHCRTRILSYSLKVTPAKHFINWQQDPEANYLGRFVFAEKTREFRVEVDLVAEMAVLNPFDFFLEPYAETYPFAYQGVDKRDLAPYLVMFRGEPLFREYLRTIPRERKRTIDWLVELNAKLARDIKYLIRMEPGVQTPELTLTRLSGSCRDSAWLLVQLLRHMGLAARFVSGYLIQLTADMKSLDGPSGPEKDFTDLHAWCEVYLPGGGWIGLDPTSGLLAGEGHIPLACTPEPVAAAPITGAVDEAEVEFEHHMKVERVWESPRVTNPYTDGQWLEIEKLGHEIDSRLVKDDVRLTMGGEPTFVSVDDPDGPEWNTAALGPDKRRLAVELYNRLKRKYAPLGLSHFGQGKWYPGEQLPRWSLNCFWRRDGQPVWNNPELLDDERPGKGVTAEDAGVFLAGVAAKLGLPPDYVFAAFEDAFYYLWRERRLPTNVDPFKSKLEDKVERERLARVFEQGLDIAVGHVLPVARDVTGKRWKSGSWYLRRERCYLIPGDSPIGYRLPLDSQPWVKKSDYPYTSEPDPMAPPQTLPAYAEVRRQLRAGEERPAEKGTDLFSATGKSQGQDEKGDRSILPDGKKDQSPPAFLQSATEITRTAMCAEPRNGTLYIFMPPADRLEDYLELVAAIEATAEAMNVPVVMEGYEPPKDPRLNSFRVTPDPGVIEVNIHPSESWTELVDRTTHLYDEARKTRLTTEKFMVDGRHTGTGGGNHFVLGGATPADSPFLRRPDLLRSLLAYWHNHPALSYLFSGLFVGPTSQAPRLDEARNDSLYELELAFKQLPPAGQTTQPWVVDRLFRNLLIDSTGNTHRSEFCIDKMFSPDGNTGRLGLLEMRAFEMPPHERMSLTQQLMLRSLIARFWREPYNPARLTRWGTELHDRFMLPYFIDRDLADVVAEQNAAGFPIQREWFAPHFEFRFPKYGDFSTFGADVELRQALEPWHVMGEEGAAGGAVRYVDSSVERLQVKVTGLAPDRYTMTCNGRQIPLRPTGNVGEFVAGVRYKAWAPPSALHPLIPSQSPLTFDLVDTWMNRSMGGCQYHVAHPGGLSPDTFPVNAFESESRRLARFVRMGHTPNKVSVPPETTNPEFPFTLDLRKV